MTKERMEAALTKALGYTRVGVNGCKQTFVKPHVGERHGSQVFTAVSFDLGAHSYWLSAWQRGGGVRIFVWIPDYHNNAAREQGEGLAKRIHDNIPQIQAEFRYGTPHELARRLGQPITNGGCN